MHTSVNIIVKIMLIVIGKYSLFLLFSTAFCHKKF